MGWWSKAKKKAKKAANKVKKASNTRVGKLAKTVGRVYGETYGGPYVILAEGALKAVRERNLKAGAQLVSDRATERLSLAQKVFSGDFKGAAEQVAGTLSKESGGSASEQRRVAGLAGKAAGLASKGYSAYGRMEAAGGPEAMAADYLGKQQRRVESAASRTPLRGIGAAQAVDMLGTSMVEGAGEYASKKASQAASGLQPPPRRSWLDWLFS